MMSALGTSPEARHVRELAGISFDDASNVVTLQKFDQIGVRGAGKKHSEGTMLDVAAIVQDLAQGQSHAHPLVGPFGLVEDVRGGVGCVGVEDADGGLDLVAFDDTVV